MSIHCSQKRMARLFFTIASTYFFAMATMHSQVVQSTQVSPGNENHYAVSEPPSWGGELLVTGTYDHPVEGLNARFKRIKSNGQIVWDFFMTADDMPNRAMHSIASMWDATASATVFGFMEEGSPEALIYGLDDSGGVTNPMKLVNLFASNLEGTTFLHGIETSDGGWLAVGEFKEGSVQSGLVVKISATGSVEWTLHVDSFTNNPLHDFDALNHVIEVPEFGFLIGGSGNYLDPTLQIRQGALISLIGYSGNMEWGETYVHSDFAGYESVAVRTVSNLNGKYFQIINGRGDFSFVKNGFSIHEIDMVNGGIVLGADRNLHIQEHPMKAMSVHAHPNHPENLIVAGFLETDVTDLAVNPNDLSVYGILPGDRPPFLMEINPSIAEPGVSCMEWHHFYDVPSSMFGLTMPTDRYNVFSNAGDQPQIFHPEMLLNNEDEEYKLIGYRDRYMVPDEFDLEFIRTDSLGFTECETYQANIIELERNIDIQSELTVSFKDYELISFVPDTYDPLMEILPCDVCFPEVEVEVLDVTCDSILIEVEPINLDANATCFDIVWSDGVTSSGSGDMTIARAWPGGASALTFTLTPYCCDLITVTGMPHFIELELPEGCDCPSCSPWMRACQTDFDDPIVSYPSSGPSFDLSIMSIFDCASGCTSAPYTLQANLINFFVPFGSGCLDDVSGVWLLDDTEIGSFPCGGYGPLETEVEAAGSYDMSVVLTNCSDPSCSNTISKMVDIGNCIPPSNPRFDIFDGAIIPCSIPKCAKSISPLQSTCSTMDSEWIIDGAYVGPGDMSLSQCFDWGHHEVELRYTCPESGETTFSIQDFYCGPTIEIGPELVVLAPEWVPSYFHIEAAVDEDCNLTVDGPRPDSPLSTFDPYESIDFGMQMNPTANENFPEDDAFNWTILVKSMDGEVMYASEQTSNGATSMADGMIRQSAEAVQIGEVCFELTGPEWLVTGNPEAFIYCVEVSDCALPDFCPSDIDGNSTIDVMDLLLLLAAYDSDCE